MFKFYFFLFLSAIFLPATVYSYSISSQTGYEINGFTGNGFNNPDYKLTKSDGQIQFYESKTEKRQLQIYKESSGLQHIYFSDNRFPSVNDVTSVVVENGKIKSQLNCLNPSLHGAGCYALNREICESVLKESGKKTLADFLVEVDKCENTLNVYDRAISKSSIQKTIDEIYSEHSNLVRKENPVLKNLHRYVFPEIFESVPLLKSAGSPKHITDYRLLGMINTCSTYLNGSAFTEATTTSGEDSSAKKKNSAR